MKIKIVFVYIIFVLTLTSLVVGQEAQPGFVISLKNGSTIRGRTLSRDEASGTLRLVMSQSSGGAPKSYAVISMEDAEAIRASTADTESIRIRLLGGSELRCKEFGLSGNTISVKIGSASSAEIRWEQIESISFGPL